MSSDVYNKILLFKCLIYRASLSSLCLLLRQFWTRFDTWAFDVCCPTRSTSVSVSIIAILCFPFAQFFGSCCVAVGLTWYIIRYVCTCSGCSTRSMCKNVTIYSALSSSISNYNYNAFVWLYHGAKHVTYAYVRCIQEQPQIAYPCYLSQQLTVYLLYLLY